MALLLPSTFYGLRAKKRSLAIRRSLENRSKRLREERVPDTFHSRILGPSTRWQIFFRQQEALDIISSKEEDLHVFAFECRQPDKKSGQRQFLVATYPVFWHYYMQLDEDQRHHYEVIPEGAPCKLYFDLEFQKCANPSADGAAMVDVLIKYVCCWLQELYGVHCNRNNVLELSASTETKFSRHLIFQGKDTVFTDNICQGHFIRAIFNQLGDHLHFDDVEKKAVGQDRGERRGTIPKAACEEAGRPGNPYTVLENPVLTGPVVQNTSVNKEVRNPPANEKDVPNPPANKEEFQVVPNPPANEEDVPNPPSNKEEEFQGVQNPPANNEEEKELQNPSMAALVKPFDEKNASSVGFDSDLCCCPNSRSGAKDDGSKALNLKCLKHYSDKHQEFEAECVTWTKAESLPCTEADCVTWTEADFVTWTEADYETLTEADCATLTPVDSVTWKGNCAGHKRKEGEYVQAACVADSGQQGCQLTANGDDLLSGEPCTHNNHATSFDPHFPGPEADSDTDNGSKCAQVCHKCTQNRTLCPKGHCAKKQSDLLPISSYGGNSDHGSVLKKDRMTEPDVEGRNSGLCENESATSLPGKADTEKNTASGDCCSRVKKAFTKVFQQFDTGQLMSLFVNDKDGKDACFADLGVYTKNRNFRLFKSRKLGKTTSFTVAEQSTYKAHRDTSDKTQGDREIFLASLICNNRPMVRYLKFDDESVDTIDKNRRGSCTRKELSGAHAPPIAGNGKSPYPEVDDFMTKQVCQRGGTVRRWTYFPQAEILSYDIVGYRFCYNVERQHRSNNIRLMADLQKGVWYQKCYDPDCQAVNFKSEEFHLPQEILPAYYLADDDDLSEGNDDVDDSVCLQALQDAEERFVPAAGSVHVDDAICLLALQDVEERLVSDSTPNVSLSHS